MSALSEQMRARAVEMDKALTHLKNTKPIDADTVNAIKAAVLPELFIVLADMLDILDNAQTLDGTLLRLQKIAQRNHAVRIAAASGDWDEIDRIARESTTAANAAGVSP